MLRREDLALLHPLGLVVRKRMIFRKLKKLQLIRTKLGAGAISVAKIAAVEEEQQAEVRVQPLIPILPSVDALR